MEERSQYNSPGYTTFKMKLKKLIGIDLNSYKEQIHRRTHELMNRWGCKTYDDYYDMMSKDEKKLREFLDHLTINVSEFFRNENSSRSAKLNASSSGAQVVPLVKSRIP